MRRHACVRTHTRHATDSLPIVLFFDDHGLDLKPLRFRASRTSPQDALIAPRSRSYDNNNASATSMCKWPSGTPAKQFSTHRGIISFVHQGLCLPADPRSATRFASLADLGSGD